MPASAGAFLLEACVVAASRTPVQPGRDQKGVKHLKELSLQGAEKPINKGRIIEMEGVLALMPFEEVPVQKRDGPGAIRW